MARGLLLRVAVGLLMVTGALLAAAPPAAAEDHTFSGTLSVPDGLSWRGTVTVGLIEPSGMSAGSGELATDGTFSFSAPAGVYDISVSGTLRATDGTDASIAHGFGTVDLDGDTHRDLAVPLRPVTIDVVDGDGNPVAVKWLDVNCTWYAGAVYSYWSMVNRDTTIGTKTMWARPDPGTDPDSNGCKVTAWRADNNFKDHRFVVSTTGDNHVTVTVPDLVAINGTVTSSDARMKPLQAQARALGDSPMGGIFEAPVAADGSYRIEAPPGPYAVLYRFDNDDHSIGASLWDVEVDASSSVTRNKHLDLQPTTVHIVDQTGEPLAPAPDHNYLSCGRETDLELNGFPVGEWIATAAPGTDPTVFLPASAEADEGWQCTMDTVFYDEENEGENSYSGRAKVPATSSSEITVVSPSYGVFDGPPTGGGEDPDGVPGIVEASGPFAGDGNNDGVPDADQDNVTTLVGNGGTLGDGNAPFVTIAAPDGATLTAVSTMEPGDLPTPPPAGVTLPGGLVSFTVEDIPVGSDQKVRVYMPTWQVTSYAKYDPATQAWSLMPADRVLVNSTFIEYVELTLTDGGVGDADGVADGRIVDPGGVAVLPTGDTTPPEVTGRATTGPNGAGWYRNNVRIDWTATDPGSGVQSQPPDTTVSTQGADVTATSPLVCDKAPTPNCGRGTVTGLKIDKTAPTLNITGVRDGQTYTLGAVPVAGCAATDALSGLAGTCKGARIGGNGAGVGGFIYAATATDRAGNSRATSAGYRVAYRFDGFLAPLNDPATPVSVFKAGSTVSVSFLLKNAAGQVVPPSSRPVWTTPVRGARTSAAVNEPVSTAKGTSGSSFVWTAGKWQYLWSTKGLAAGYQYRIGVRLDDGTTRTLVVALR
ncbi:MAG: PxKF domain-containing protein [Nocardioides sp.]